MNKSELATSLMREHRMNCSPIILSIFSEEYALDRKTALQIAMGFGGGMARTGKTCGAVSGAYMVLGLDQVITPENPRSSMENCYALIHEFNRRFREIHGSLLCQNLLGVNLNMKKGLAVARDQNLFTTVCPNFVGDAARILEELLTKK